LVHVQAYYLTLLKEKAGMKMNEWFFYIFAVTVSAGHDW